MSINVVENITLDVHNTDLVYISCVEGEVNSRFVTVNFVDYDSPYNLNGKSVKLYILKSDGTEIFKDGNIDDEINGIATFPLSSQMSSVVGKFDVVFKIYSTNPSSELKVIGTILEVKKGNTDCGIESSNDFSALQTAITKVDTILDSANIATINANDAALNANTAAANANIAISNANDAANKASNLPYIGADGYWYVYNTTLSDYQKSSVQASVSYKNNYDSSITYALNDEVYDEVTNTTYRSLKNDNTSSLTDTTSWGIISKGIGVTTDNNFTDAEKTKVDNAIQGIKLNNVDLSPDTNNKVNINITPSDIGAATAAQGAKADSAVQSNQMGVASGVATLDSNGKVVQQLSDSVIATIHNLEHPVNSLYLSMSSTNPHTLFGGTWIQIAQGKMLIGVNSNDTDFNAANKTGGSKTHTNTIDEMPTHRHLEVIRGQGGTLQGFGVAAVHDDLGGMAESVDYTEPAGGGQAYSIMNPYVTCYIWQRTA